MINHCEYCGEPIEEMECECLDALPVGFPKRTYKEKKEIARQVYLEIREIVDKWDAKMDIAVNCCWDECLLVDNVLFHGCDLDVSE